MMKKTKKFITTKPVHRQYWKETEKDKNINKTKQQDYHSRAVVKQMKNQKIQNPK